MNFFKKLLNVKWGIILILVGCGVLFSIILPVEAMVIALAFLLIFVGICLLKNDNRRF